MILIYIKHLKLFFLLIVFINAVTLKAQLPPNDNNYELVFVDEFNGASLDATKWDKMFPWNQGSNYASVECGGVNHNVPAAYRKWKDENGNPDTTNTKVNNGTLKLFTRKESYEGEVWSWPNGNFEIDTLPYEFTTAMLFSKKKYRYGYFEIRFKLPSPPSGPKRHLGFGPNFWMYGADENGDYSIPNQYSEIDIFEINSFDTDLNKSNEYTSNVHYEPLGTSNIHYSQTQSYGHISSDVWHKASVLWTPEKIVFYLDDNKLGDFPASETNIPPDDFAPMNLIIDINSPNIGFCNFFDTLSSNGTSFPYVYEIDYVKVWQLKQDCNSAKSDCNFNPSTYNSKLYKSITMGGSGCNSTLHYQDLNFYATDYILLNSGVTIDYASSVILDIKECENYQFFGD